MFGVQMRQKAKNTRREVRPEPLVKCRTGIAGLDEITFGGLPARRTTLVCGGAGCGKTLLGLEFLVRGATEFDEPGVCISFEETAEDFSRNVVSLGFEVDKLIEQRKLAIEGLAEIAASRDVRSGLPKSNSKQPNPPGART
jgi:circadian clock protein KaiC